MSKTRKLGASLRRLATRAGALAALLAMSGSQAQTEAGPDLWNFDDLDDADPGVFGIVHGQLPDIALFAAFATLAMISFFRNSKPLKYVTLVVCVLYMGVAKSQLISIVNVFSTLTGDLAGFLYNLTFYAFAGFTVITTLLFGRLYCGRICAFGAFTQLLDSIVPSRLQYELPSALERRASYIKYAILFGAIGLYLVSYFQGARSIGFYRYIEPFWMFSFHATTVLWVMLAILLIASVFVRNLYCRFLCPLGAALGLLSSLSVFKIKRWSECSQCQLCEKVCEWGAIRERKIVMSECVRCDDCERLYDDKQGCPHWLLAAKRERRATEIAVAPPTVRRAPE